jgi:hypothetical protein
VGLGQEDAQWLGHQAGHGTGPAQLEFGGDAGLARHLERRQLDAEVNLVGTVLEAEAALTVGTVTAGAHA